MPKIDVGSGIRINAYEVISRAVEEGLAYGYRRAYKHTEAPTEAQMLTEMENAVMNTLCEVINFDG